MWPGGRVLSAGIVWFLHMHSRNRMMARLEVTLRTRNIHVVYFHSSYKMGSLPNLSGVSSGIIP